MSECDHIIGWNDSDYLFFRMNMPLTQSEYSTWALTMPIPNAFKFCPECGTKINEI